MTSINPRFLPTQPLSGSQVVNLLHSGYNVSSKNLPNSQNLIITENPNIIPKINTPSTSATLTPLLIIGGIVLLIVLLK